MPAVLTHKSIMLLARERVSRIHAALQAKVDAGGPNITTLDRQMLAIAAETSRIFASEPRPRTELPGILFANPVGADGDSYPISQYAVMGSMGPDITAFSHILTKGQAWVFDTVHKGTPDPNRELVNAQTCDFVLTFWKKVEEQISNAIEAGTERNAQLDKMRAYTLGHLCHVAADVISHPYINQYQWVDPPRDVEKYHAKIEGEIDALVATTLLRRESTRSGQGWDTWWPGETPPEQFFSAYADALEQVYSAQSSRRKGYREFEEVLQALGPQPLTADFVKDGYNLLRHGVVAKGYGYGYWSWWGWLALFTVPAIALPLVVAALPKGGNIFLKKEENRTERAWMEFVSAPFLFAMPATIGYGALLGSLTTGGVSERYWLGMSGAIVSAVSGVLLLATLPVDDLHPGFSWPVLFVVPLGFSLLQAILALVDLAEGNKKRMAIGLVFAIPLVMHILFFVFFGIIPGLAAPDGDAGNPFESEGFWVSFVFWTLGFLVLWFLVPYFVDRLSRHRIPEKPAGDIVKRRFVRVFDEATLHHDSDLEDDSIPHQVYPSGRRKLVKLWWDGDGDLFIRSDRFQLVFSSNADGSNPQIVPAPIAPMSLRDYMSYLTATVAEPGGGTGHLQWELATAQQGDSAESDNDLADDPDYELPAGAVFADHGDDKEGAEAHAEAAAQFVQLATSAEASDYHLYHAYKSEQAIHYGEKGAVAPDRNLGIDNPISHNPDEEGYPYLHNPATAEATETLMSFAGDFGAILSMAATTHMVSGLEDSEDNSVNKVYQVFRNWNLDRRRVNEWRTLVAGNSLGEKGANRSGYDSKMLGGILRPSDHATWQEPLLGSSQAAFDEGEQTARQMGWIKVMREWMDVSADPAQNTLDGTSSFKPGNPSNQALSRAMAYLFDLTDPTGAP